VNYSSRKPPRAFFLQSAKGGYGLGELVHFSGHLAVGRRYGCGIDTQVEEGGANRSAAFEGEMPIEAQAPRPVERGHERPVEEHQFGHATGRIYAMKAEPVYSVFTERLAAFSVGGTP